MKGSCAASGTSLSQILEFCEIQSGLRGFASAADNSSRDTVTYISTCLSNHEQTMTIYLRPASFKGPACASSCAQPSTREAMATFSLSGIQLGRSIWPWPVGADSVMPTTPLAGSKTFSADRGSEFDTLCCWDDTLCACTARFKTAAHVGIVLASASCQAQCFYFRKSDL